jgi:hypothetical protein
MSRTVKATKTASVGSCPTAWKCDGSMEVPWCAPGDACFCIRTSKGRTCTNGGVFCGVDCTKTSDCPPGTVCALDTCCGAGSCLSNTCSYDGSPSRLFRVAQSNGVGSPLGPVGPKLTSRREERVQGGKGTRLPLDAKLRVRRMEV